MQFIISGEADLTPSVMVLLYGFSGSGKTHWASTAPRPLFVLFEPQAIPTIQAVRPDAGIILVRTWADFRKVLKMIQDAEPCDVNGQVALRLKMKSGSFIFQTLVVDSITQLQVEMLREVRGIAAGSRFDLKKLGSSSFQQWGRVADVLCDVFDDLRALPCSVICIALAEERYDDNKRRRVLPDLQGSAQRKAPQYFSAAGYVTLDSVKNHIVVWRGDSRFVTKPAPGWPRIIPAEVTLGSLLLHTFNNSEATPASDNDSALQVEEARARYPERAVASEDEAPENTATDNTED